MINTKGKNHNPTLITINNNNETLSIGITPQLKKLATNPTEQLFLFPKKKQLKTFEKIGFTRKHWEINIDKITTISE
jgi:hypothetical protein